MENKQPEKLREENEILKEKILKLEKELIQARILQDDWTRLSVKFKFLTENTPLGFIEWTTDFRVREWSISASKIFGYTSEEALGKKGTDLILPDDLKETACALFQKIISEKTPLSNSNKNCRKNRSIIYCEWYNIPVTDIDGNITGIASFVNDVTDHIKKEEELEKAKQKAEDSDNLKSYFLANMSHEIRTPMNGILGFAELLKDPDINEEKKLEYVERINSCGIHLLHLINDIIDISKLEAGKIAVYERECSLSALFFELFFFFQSENVRNDKSKIELVLQKEIEDDKGRILTDITRLRQILTNLIGNAIKFTRQGQVAFGYTFKDKQNVLFFVKDTGIGIPKEKLSIIFDRFRQVDSSTTRKFGGTGLGLAISKGLVELLGGTIWVESEEHEGSVFYFTIPNKIHNAKTEIKEESGESNVYNWSDKLILIVEDEYTNYEYILGILEDTFVKILYAPTATKAIELAEQNKNIHLILMDIKLPDMSGLEATKIIHKFNPGIPVVAQTAYAMTEDKSKALNAGCVAYLSKPYDVDIFLRVIDRNL